MGRRRPRARDCAGERVEAGIEPRVDESRGAREDLRNGRSALLVALACEALAQRRGIRTRAEGENGAARLRRRRGADRSGAAGRHRMSYRAGELFFPEARRWWLGRGRSGAEGSAGDLSKMNDAQILERL